MRLPRLAIAGLAGLMWIAGCSKPSTPPPSANDVSEFSNALNDGDAMVVDRLLSAKPALANTPTSEGKLPLKVAKEKGNDELANVIKKHGGHE